MLDPTRLRNLKSYGFHMDEVVPKDEYRVVACMITQLHALMDQATDVNSANDMINRICILKVLRFYRS